MGRINALARVAHAREEGKEGGGREGEGEVIASMISLLASIRAPDCYCAVIRMHVRAWIESGQGREEGGSCQISMLGSSKVENCGPYLADPKI